jgi:hypothetical protein
MANMKEDSKKNWTSGSTKEDIGLGCLQRIADATEAMAGPYLKAISDRDMYERWYREGSVKIQKRDRQIASLRGVITRMKNKQRHG